MKRPKRDPVREDRIHNEAIVDARPEEQAMSWYYYLEGKISFPFQAKCVAAKIISPLRKGEDRRGPAHGTGEVSATRHARAGPMAGAENGRSALSTDRHRPRRINRRSDRRLALLGRAGLSFLIPLRSTHAHRNLTDHLNRRLSFGSRLGWRDATEVPFYGLGMKSSQDDRTSFRFQETYADGHVAFRPVKWFVTTGSLAYEHWEVKEGEGSFPSIETQHTAQTAPGLGVSPSFVHTQGSAGIDWRRSPGYTRTGGLYEMTFHDYHNTSGGTYSFQKLTGEVIQHVPVLRETWVLAARGQGRNDLERQ